MLGSPILLPPPLWFQRAVEESVRQSVRRAPDGGLGVEGGSMIGLLWDAVSERMVDRSRLKEAEAPKRESAPAESRPAPAIGFSVDIGQPAAIKRLVVR